MIRVLIAAFHPSTLPPFRPFLFPSKTVPGSFFSEPVLATLFWVPATLFWVFGVNTHLNDEPLLPGRFSFVCSFRNTTYMECLDLFLRALLHKVLLCKTAFTT